MARLAYLGAGCCCMMGHRHFRSCVRPPQHGRTRKVRRGAAAEGTCSRSVHSPWKLRWTSAHMPSCMCHPHQTYQDGIEIPLAAQGLNPKRCRDIQSAQIHGGKKVSAVQAHAHPRSSIPSARCSILKFHRRPVTSTGAVQPPQQDQPLHVHHDHNSSKPPVTHAHPA